MSSLLTELQSALRREIESGELLELDEEFYSRVRSRVRVLALSSPAPDIVVSKAKETLRRLMLLRLLKEVAYLWSSGEAPSARRIPKEERMVLNAIANALSSITDFEGESLHAAQKRAGEGGELLLVLFKKPCPKLMLEDGRVLGPFSAGDMAIVQKTSSNVIEKLGVAAVVAELEE